MGQTRRRGLRPIASALRRKLISSVASPLRKKSRLLRLFACKRALNASASLPTFCEYGTGTLATSLGQNQPFRYRGYVYDTETGWHYLQSRYYNPEVGRFISSDVLLSTGQGVLGHNSYAYCLNNPVNMSDEGGCRPFSIEKVADYISANPNRNREGYATEREALNAFHDEYSNGLSHDVEYASYIYCTTDLEGNKTYGYAMPRTDGYDNFVFFYEFSEMRKHKSLPDEWKYRVVAIIHTHPEGSSIIASDIDMKSLRNFRYESGGEIYKGYVVTLNHQTTYYALNQSGGLKSYRYCK
ncbi:MAG: RHS repeat-associated core domain-containing protein [Eubacteriales bacterium]|nr:RHS repeat-associated core domain-containing protein [Eubacteriales bacterium]